MPHETERSVEVLPDGEAFGHRLSDDLAEGREFACAVAFAKESVLDVIDLEQWCQRGRRLRLLAGTDFALTELELLRRLNRSAGAECRVYHALEDRCFHPKLYVVEKEASTVVYVGSSNLTKGGLRSNVEANVRLEGARNAGEIAAARELFGRHFDGEFATPLNGAFEQRYEEMQRLRRNAYLDPRLDDARHRMLVMERLAVADQREKAASKRWLLVTSPENFEICMRFGVWGRQHEHEVRRYAPGDLFFFHVTERSEIVAMGMFTGTPFRDEVPLWPASKAGAFPWRIRFVSLGELARAGIPTRRTLEPLRRDAPHHWFHGFIQQSHELLPTDAAALRVAFEGRLRVQQSVPP